MPWRCPACRSSIRSGVAEDRPRLHVVYRCPVCRLELMLDEETGKLTLAPLADARVNAPTVEDLLVERRRTQRALDKKP
jgi:hypothetical protein